MAQPQNPLPRETASLDPTFAQAVERLHRISVYGRWAVVCLLWLTIGVLSLWGLRSQLGLLMDYFTWSALRYGIIYNHLPALGLAFCIGMTAAVLVWQTRNILWGRPQHEQQRLEQQVLRIHKQGPSHPLWKLVREHPSSSGT